MRIGFGYDVHRFATDRRLVLGGVEIPHEFGLAGHSDADVLLHAVIDAMFGAAALGDIGSHFPDTDPRWKGADSIDLLDRATQLLREGGWMVVNIDATVVAERPMLRPYIDAMRGRIAEAVGVAISRVSVKATTSEGLGFVGSEEGIASYAVCLITER